MSMSMSKPHIPNNLNTVRVLHVGLVVSYINSLEGKTIHDMFFPHKNLLRCVSEDVHSVVIPKMNLMYCSSIADCIIFTKEKEIKFVVTDYNSKDINIDIYVYDRDRYKMACECVNITNFVHNQKDFV